MNLPRFLRCLAGATCLVACSPQPATPVAAPEASILLTVERVCGECHLSTRADALPEVLAHFDLVDPDWLSGIPWEKFEASFMPLILPWIEFDTAETVYRAIAVDLAKRRGAE
jgi:hypothetical protein